MQSTTRESRASGDPQSNNNCADFRACSEAIDSLRFFLSRRHPRGQAIKASQVFTRLGGLREVLRTRPASEVPCVVLSLLNECRGQLRASISPKKRRLRNRLRHVGKAQDLLGQAQARLTERKRACQQVWVLVIVEITIVPCGDHQHQRPEQYRTQPRKKGRRRPDFRRRFGNNGTGQHN
jgi:hypothetical protein